MKTMTLEQVIEFLNSDDCDDIDNYAFRGDTFIPVKKFRRSKYHGDDCKSFTLPGASAIGIPSYDDKFIINSYLQAKDYGRHVFLIRGNIRNAHPVYHDHNEVIVLNNTIIARIID